MSLATNRQPDPTGTLLSAQPAEDVDAVLREVRQQFIDSFVPQCERLEVNVSRQGEEPRAECITTLHRMAGLAGTVGFRRVSEVAGALEDALRSGKTVRIPDDIDELRSAFADGIEAPPLPFPSANRAPMQVLLVEDELVQRTMIAAQIVKAGHIAIEVASGEEALVAARSARPDAILLDVELPGISGYSVCRILKADPTLAGIPVAFLSAHSGIDARLTGLSFGADDFLTKPVDPRELALRLHLLNRHAQPGDSGATRGVLTYEVFGAEAAAAVRHERAALALIRTPPEQASLVASFTRDEIRRRDLCGQYDRGHVVVLLADTGAAAGRDRIAAIVEKCRDKGLNGVYAGIAASPAGGARTIEQLLEDADEALAIARYEGLSAAIKPDGPREPHTVKGVEPLVVVGDDDPDVVRIVDAHLAAGGYRRVLTFDGSRTLEEVRAQRPAVLVLDLMMPRMTGFDVLAGLRDMGDGRPRVVVLSARGREEDLIRAFSLGADDFMVKPFNPQELLARIGRLVK